MDIAIEHAEAVFRHGPTYPPSLGAYHFTPLQIPPNLLEQGRGHTLGGGGAGSDSAWSSWFMLPRAMCIERLIGGEPD